MAKVPRKGKMARTKETIAAGSSSKVTETRGNDSSDDNQSLFKDSENDAEEEAEEEEEEEDEGLVQGPAPKPRYDRDWSIMTRGMFSLFRRLGFSTETTRYMITVEALDHPRHLKELDNDQCKQVVKNARKAYDPDSGELLTAANRAMTNLQLAVLVARHYARTSRELNPDDIDVDLFPAFKAQAEVEEHQRKEKPDLPTGLVLDNTPKAARVFDAVVEHLGRHRGISGAPLSYVIRTNIYPPDGTDPLFTNAPRTRYTSFDDEMIRRSPILLTPTTSEAGPYHPSFLADMVKVWGILHDLFSKQPVWIHVKGKPFARTRNGRLCFQELHRHLLGQNNAHQLGQALVDKLQTIKYDGQTKNWNFDKYVAAHVDIHNQALHLEPYGFNTMTRYVKVNAFTRNISEKAGFGPVAMSVLADPTLQDDFDRVKQLYNNYHRRHLLHATGTTGGIGPRSVHDGYRGKVPTQAQLDACKVMLRHFTSDDYNKLDWISKYKLNVMRRERDGGGKKPRAATSTVSSLTHSEGTTDNADGGNQPPTVVTHDSSGSTSNSGNPALVCPTPDRR
jgi:hypothetical protein